MAVLYETFSPKVSPLPELPINMRTLPTGTAVVAG
jgi:hypothetical protein